jgi:hypothetical protein
MTFVEPETVFDENVQSGTVRILHSVGSEVTTTNWSGFVLVDGGSYPFINGRLQRCRSIN